MVNSSISSLRGRVVYVVSVSEHFSSPLQCLDIFTFGDSITVLYYVTYMLDMLLSSLPICRIWCVHTDRTRGGIISSIRGAIRWPTSDISF